MTEEKTEQASAKQLRKARKEGRVAKSSEFTATAVAVVALAALLLSSGTISAEFQGLFRETLRIATQPTVDPGQIAPFLFQAFLTGARIIGPVLASALLIAALVAYLQIGPVFSLKPVIPDGSRLNMANGLKQLFDKSKLVELTKNVGKISLLGSVGYIVYLQSLPGLVRSSRLDLTSAMAVLADSSSRLAKYLVGGLIVFGLIDLFWQRHKFSKEMMMSKQEVKNEYKESEGSPEVKGRRKQLHRELLAEASVSRVKDADAVVVNPTHVAVALRYDESEMDAPRVVARGRGKVAERMRRLARKHDVPIVRDVPLARALVSLDDDETIPEDLFEAVAEVLRYVYSLKETP